MRFHRANTDTERIELSCSKRGGSLQPRREQLLYSGRASLVHLVVVRHAGFSHTRMDMRRLGTLLSVHLPSPHSTESPLSTVCLSRVSVCAFCAWD